jgi:RNA polymerase sigma factor (sigma-70 family)
MGDDTTNSPLQGLTDEELACRSQTGDTTSFEELVVRYEGRLLRYLEQRCGNRHDAEDLAQKSFVAAYRALARFDARRPFRAWLFVIAQRQAFSHGRRRKMEGLPPEEQWPAPLESGSRDHGPDVWALARSRLPGNLFDALWFRYAEDMTVSEVAQAMDVTGLHARVLLHRARKRLADEVRKERP